MCIGFIIIIVVNIVVELIVVPVVVASVVASKEKSITDIVRLVRFPVPDKALR